jgi:hypothetical protein
MPALHCCSRGADATKGCLRIAVIGHNPAKVLKIGESYLGALRSWVFVELEVAKSGKDAALSAASAVSRRRRVVFGVCRIPSPKDSIPLLLLLAPQRHTAS